MTPGLPSDRRRLVDAMGLGPVWVRRTRATIVDALPVGADATALGPPDPETLDRMASSGRACGLVARPAQALHGAGAMRCEWLVVGAPAVGDAGGDAFAGAAGRLLDAMLAAIGLGLDPTVCVASLAQCPSHSGRASSTACRPDLDRQIEGLAPRMLLLVGEVASTALFPDAAARFDAFRGRAHSLTIAGREIPVVVTFHPSRLLDDGAAKAAAWADLCLARAVYDGIPAAVIA